jgi:hypothetical protein
MDGYDDQTIQVENRSLVAAPADRNHGLRGRRHEHRGHTGKQST